MKEGGNGLHHFRLQVEIMFWGGSCYKHPANSKPTQQTKRRGYVYVRTYLLPCSFSVAWNFFSHTRDMTKLEPTSLKQEVVQSLPMHERTLFCEQTHLAEWVATVDWLITESPREI